MTHGAPASRQPPAAAPARSTGTPDCGCAARCESESATNQGPAPGAARGRGGSSQATGPGRPDERRVVRTQRPPQSRRHTPPDNAVAPPPKAGGPTDVPARSPVPSPVRGIVRIHNQAQPQAENRAAVPRQFGQGGEGLAIIGQTPGRRTRGARGRRRQRYQPLPLQTAQGHTGRADAQPCFGIAPTGGATERFDEFLARWRLRTSRATAQPFQNLTVNPSSAHAYRSNHGVEDARTGGASLA